jgi:hypothetical protein
VKKAVAILLLSTLLVSLTGFHLLYRFQIGEAKAEMHERLHAGLMPSGIKKLVIKAQDRQQIQWEEANREFYFEGKMFDVIRLQEKDSVLIIDCISDEKESRLVQQLLLQNNKDHTSKPASFLLIKLLTTVYVPRSSEIVYLPLDSQENQVWLLPVCFVLRM